VGCGGKPKGERKTAFFAGEHKEGGKYAPKERPLFQKSLGAGGNQPRSKTGQHDKKKKSRTLGYPLAGVGEGEGKSAKRGPIPKKTKTK